MDWAVILESVKGAVPFMAVVLQVLGSLVVVASVLVKLTPSQSDDALIERAKAIPVLGSLIVALERFSVFARKE